MRPQKKPGEIAPDNGLIRAALDRMPHSVVILDHDLRLAARNQQFLSLYRLAAKDVPVGATLGELLRASVAAGNHPGSTAEDLEKELRERLQSRHRRRVNFYERIMDDGRTLRVSCVPIPGGAWVISQEDVSEVKRYVDALREREEEILRQNATLDFAVRNMRQAMCLYDADGRLVFSNPQYADMYNIPRDRIVPGMTLDEVLEVREAYGNYAVGGNPAFVAHRVTFGEDEPAAFVVEMEDGRAVSILHQPLKDGGWVATHWDITEERRSEARIRHLARHDPLTDLPNRILLREHMEDLETRAERGEMMAVLCIDLDHFKEVNDKLGHAIGDDVLKQVAARLISHVRESDVCARLGGDEFAILCGPLERPQEASALAARIVEAIAEPFSVNDHRVLIGASIGIAVAPTDGCEAEALLKAADLACYRAKHNGRGTYRFFKKSMDEAMRKRRQLELGLREALSSDQLSLVFQPFFDLRTDTMSGVEALLRWHHPEHGDIPPDQFISVAEDAGLIAQIGDWVLRQACAAAARWPDHIGVAVNLSPVQFKQGQRLTETVVSALAGSGLTPRRLELEITESVLLFHMDGALKILHQLRDLGVRISMDDFGTGYSSLSYLRSFPFDKIKIDRSFVQDTSVNHDGSAIISAVVGLGRTLGMSVTAEGVETAEQLALVRSHGCNEAQGFFLGRPVPFEAITKLLGANAGRTVRPDAVESIGQAGPLRARA